MLTNHPIDNLQPVFLMPAVSLYGVPYFPQFTSLKSGYVQDN